MRWSSLLLPLSLLSTGVLAASKKATERFDTYHKKALTSTPIKIDDVDYKKLTTGSRDYTVAVLLTAMDARYSCTLCKEFQPEWDLLSSSWKNGDKAGKSRTLFTTLDFNDGRETFMSVCATSKICDNGPRLTGCCTARSANCPGPPPLPA